MQRCGLPEQSSLVVRLRNAAQGGELEAVTGYCAASSSPPCFGALARPRHFKLAERGSLVNKQKASISLSLQIYLGISLSLSPDLSRLLEFSPGERVCDLEREIDPAMVVED